MNLEKKYLDENIWVIEDFLTEEELAWIKVRLDDPNHWYTTMRSPYNNILNKFLGVVPIYNDKGEIQVPGPDSEVYPPGHPEHLDIFSRPNGIWERIEKVMPPTYKRHATIQTFKYVTDDYIEANRRSTDKELEIASGDAAMYYHEDPIIAVHSFSIYLNDDFDGGELEFLNQGIVIKPKAGMMVGVPVGDRYIHKVNKVLGPNHRHTLYGNSWKDPRSVAISTTEDC